MRSPLTGSGSNIGGIDAARDDADAASGRRRVARAMRPAMKWLIAITRSPRAITAL